MLSDNNSCGSKLLLALPDDIFAVVTRSLKPKDVFNLSLCCRSLYVHAGSDKVWLTQCELLGVIPHKDLIEWRKGVNSYKALCRFLVYVQPLIGIWVHQNPELGNVVYVMPGFISLVGCRIIPQELGPLGIDEGPILWSPVFEILGNVDGSSAFIFHGRERGNNYMYPGSIKGIDRNCNVLLLEVEPRQQKDGGKLVHSKSFAGNPNPVDKSFRERFVRQIAGFRCHKEFRVLNHLSRSVVWLLLTERNFLRLLLAKFALKYRSRETGCVFLAWKPRILIS
ncbi:putative F-box domain containing protein [Helianthus annuus]|nr:putative F-box domain containing protein [Helianthus annuus]